MKLSKPNYDNFSADIIDDETAAYAAMDATICLLLFNKVQENKLSMFDYPVNVVIGNSKMWLSHEEAEEVGLSHGQKLNWCMYANN